jgi:hypothetical protein
MGFETKVLDIVAEVLENNNSAEFSYGSMFVDCTARQAAKIETALSEILNCSVVVTPGAEEFAFDFV